MAGLRVKNYKSIIVMMQFSTQTFRSLNFYVILINQLSDKLILQFCPGMKSICKNLSLKFGLKNDCKTLI